MNYYGLAAAVPLYAAYRAIYGENTWADKLASWHASRSGPPPPVDLESPAPFPLAPPPMSARDIEEMDKFIDDARFYDYPHDALWQPS